MANTIVTPTIFTRMTLANLGGYLNVCRNMNNSYSSQFAQETRKIGDTLNVRRPQRFQVTTGLGYQPQAIANTQVAITVDTVAGVHFEWDSIERALSLQDINERYAKPAAIALAHYVNQQAAAYIAKRTANAVGTPGTVPNSMLTYLNAGDRLIELGLPENENLACIISRRMSSTYVNAVSALQNPAGSISSQYRKGRITESDLGYDWFLDQTLFSHTVGAFAGTPLVNGADQTGTGGDNAEQSIITDGWTATTSALAEGDVLTFAGCNAVHPQTRVSTGQLKQFVVRSAVTADGSGNKTITIFPSITTTGQYQNVSAAPANNAVITVLGAASTATPQGLLMHKNAFAFLSVPLADPEPGTVQMVSRETDPDTGVTLSFIRDFDSRERTFINRFDMLFGFGRLYAEMACRIAS